MKRARGFTLIEIMVVVTIVGILAAIAWPSYQNQLRKGRRAEAQSFMMELSNKEQQYLLDARQYALDPGAIATLNSAAPADLTPQFYTFTITVGATAVPPTYIITATALNQQAADGNLTIDSTGQKTRGGNPGW